MKSVKISELPKTTTYQGLQTIATTNEGESVKVDLDALQSRLQQYADNSAENAREEGQEHFDTAMIQIKVLQETKAERNEIPTTQIKGLQETKADKSEIPTCTSDLENDSGFVYSSDLNGINNDIEKITTAIDGKTEELKKQIRTKSNIIKAKNLPVINHNIPINAEVGRLYYSTNKELFLNIKKIKNRNGEDMSRLEKAKWLWEHCWNKNGDATMESMKDYCDNGTQIATYLANCGEQGEPRKLNPNKVRIFLDNSRRPIYIDSEGELRYKDIDGAVAISPKRATILVPPTLNDFEITFIDVPVKGEKIDKETGEHTETLRIIKKCRIDNLIINNSKGDIETMNLEYQVWKRKRTNKSKKYPRQHIMGWGKSHFTNRHLTKHNNKEYGLFNPISKNSNVYKFRVRFHTNGNRVSEWMYFEGHSHGNGSYWHSNK